MGASARPFFFFEASPPFLSRVKWEAEQKEKLQRILDEQRQSFIFLQSILVTRFKSRN
jgi:hypothetical protein